MKVVECYFRMQEFERGAKELRDLIREFPGFLSARLRLGRAFYEAGDVASAIEQWESVLLRDPNHNEAQNLLRQAQVSDHTGQVEL